MKVLAQTGYKTIIAAGGVVANSIIRADFGGSLQKGGLPALPAAAAPLR